MSHNDFKYTEKQKLDSIQAEKDAAELVSNSYPPVSYATTENFIRVLNALIKRLKDRKIIR